MTGDCFEWSGLRNDCGYGRTWSKETGPIKAHRLAWIKAHGPIPAGMCVLHRCDNPPCINLDHLFLGTDLDNVRDMLSKGRDRHPTGPDHWSSRHPERTLKGEAHPMVKLNDAQVTEILRRRRMGESCADIAPVYGVSAQHVSRLVRGKRRASSRSAA
jgi:HNH endonuclease